MIKNAKIFNGRTMIMNNGDKVRVLTTPHHINRSEIPEDLKVYSLIKKRENHYMVDKMDTTNTEDFVMSMISHIEVALGSDIELTDSDLLYGSYANMSIQEYYIETVGIIKLYVMMHTDDVSPDEVIKRLNAAHRCFAIACGRDVDDIEILNKFNEIDPYDANFENEVDISIYHLTKNLRIMGKATHILDISSAPGFLLRIPCNIERHVCEKYNLNRIDVALINRAVMEVRRENDDLDIIMGKTDVIGNPSRSCFDNPLKPSYIYTPDPGINYDNSCMYDSSVGFPLQY